MIARLVVFMAITSSVLFASDEDISFSVPSGSRIEGSLAGEFSVSPSPPSDVISSQGTESLTAHSGIVLTETGQGGAGDQSGDNDDDAKDDLYDKKKKTVNLPEPEAEPEDKNAYQWWTRTNTHRDLYFMSTFNPS